MVRIFLFFLILLPSLEAQNNQIFPINQNEIINHQKELLDSYFWINKVKSPQKVILSPPTIKSLNKKIIRQGYLLNPLNLGNTLNSSLVIGYLENHLQLIHHYIKYDLQGNRYRDPAFRDYLTKLIDLANLKKKSVIKVKYGLTIQNIDIRFFPTEKIYVRKKSDYHFDIMQKSHLSLGQPIAILHTSRDRQWYLVETPYVLGWIKKEAVAQLSLEELKNYLAEEKEVIITSVITKAFRQKKINSSTYKFIPMGIALKLAKENKQRNFYWGGKWVEVLLPQKNQQGEFIEEKFYIKRKDINYGFLSFTLESLFQQSFKFLNTPYIWGGSVRGVDCSLFLVRLFNTFGIHLPRSSNLQRKVFSQELKNLKNIPSPQIAFISQPNHIMLFLGEHQGEDYFIHSTWSFKNANQQEFEIKSVIISDGHLGIGSNMGSLVERIKYKGTIRIN